MARVRSRLLGHETSGPELGFVIAVIAICSGCGLPPPEPMTSSILQAVQSSIIGTWRIVLADDRSNNRATWVHTYGNHPRGYLIYDASGHVSVQFTSDPPMSPFASGDDFAATDAEIRHAYENYVAYFGTYTVDESRSVVTHHVEGSLLPS